MAVYPNQLNQFDIYNQQTQQPVSNQINPNVAGIQNLQQPQVNTTLSQEKPVFVASPFTMRQRSKMSPLKCECQNNSNKKTNAAISGVRKKGYKK